MALNFTGQNLRGRSFRGQNLSGGIFSHANLQGADFTGATLTDADFSHTHLQGTRFTQATLQRSQFTYARTGLQPLHRVVLSISSLLTATLAGLGAGLAGSWISNLLLSDNSLLKFGSANVVNFHSPAAGMLALVVIIAVLTRLLTQGLKSAAQVGGITALIAGSLITTIIALKTGVGNSSGEISVAVGGAAAVAVILAIVPVLLIALSAIVLKAPILAGVAASVGIVVSVKLGTVSKVANWVLISTWAGGSVLILLGLFVAQRIFRNKQGYERIKDLAIVFTTKFGTDFRAADLTDANLSNATLKHCDFRRAILSRARWHQVKQLDWARVGATILADATVRNLLVNGNGAGQSYINANLQAANLIDADLSHANFSGANLSGASLHGASLEWADLTQVQAIGTDFTNAQMTGVCGLGTWNIDSSTLLQDIDCRWVYLLEHPKPGTDDRERRPSSGEFAPEEFVSLFRQVIDTIDLIFRNGIDQQAFSQTFQRIQMQHADSQLEIQSIENKGNGIVVVKLRTSTEVNKSEIHSQFMQFYQDAIALSHQQTEMLHQHEQAIQAILDRLLGHPMQDQVVVLHVGQGTFEQGFPVTLQILQDGISLPFVQQVGALPPNNEILPSYQYWQSAYRRTLKAARLDVPSQVTNVSGADFFSDCLAAAERLSQQMNCWLAAESFQLIERTMHIKLNCDQSIRVILQTDQAELRQLPWQTWQFFEDYPQAEIALSKLSYHTPKLTAIAPRTVKQHIRILAILGDSQGIDLNKDRAALEVLDAEVTFLVTPDRQSLNDTLRKQSWDILYFGGHSQSQPDRSSGRLWINATEHLAIAEIRSALNRVISRGLQLAIFNSCDGLGLANALADLQIPQIIVMREPIADVVAQAFLIAFLKHFSAGQSLYQSVREAREQLQDLKELYPGATWLPIIVQNPAEKPRTWETLKNLNHRVQA